MPIDPSVLFRSSGQRDDRRRLLLCEPTVPAQGVPARKRSRRKRSQPISPHYGDGAFLEQIPRLTDLIPRQLWPYGVALLLGLGMIAGLEWLYAGLMPQLAPWTTDGSVAAFDLGAEGTLADWFSSTTLFLAAGVSVIVYLVRRYRRDDYQGRYRIWLWAAMCWLLMSVDETAGLHKGFKEMMVLLTGQRLGGDGSLWWAAVYFFLLGGVGVRLLADMRECRLSSTVLVGAAVCFATTVGVQLEWLFAGWGAQGIMLEEGAEMLGDWLLLVAMALHARHVILDAEGRLAHQAESEASAAESKSADLFSDQMSSSPASDLSSAGAGLAVHSTHGALGGGPHAGGASTGAGLTASAPAASSSPGASWWSGASATGTACSGTGSVAASTTGVAGATTPSSQSAATGTSAWPSPVRRLTEAEKKALRRKLEKLRKQRESQGQNS